MNNAIIITYYRLYAKLKRIFVCRSAEYYSAAKLLIESVLLTASDVTDKRTLSKFAIVLDQNISMGIPAR